LVLGQQRGRGWLLGFALIADFERVADQSWLPKL
jgi:hypothetical protein